MIPELAVTYSEIPLEYRVPFRGRYNRAITYCRFCDYDLDFRQIKKHETAHERRMMLIEGFAEKDGNVFQVYECPGCHEILYNHACKAVVDGFLDYHKKLDHFWQGIMDDIEEAEQCA